MNLNNEVENSYILHEVESKLNGDDLQRWLESLDDHVDTRRVNEFVIWLDKQTHIRRLRHLAYSREVNTYKGNLRYQQRKGNGQYNLNSISDHQRARSNC